MSMHDIDHCFETPEGIEIELPIAGPCVRFCALLIDATIRGILYPVIAMLLIPLGEAGIGLFLVIMFLIEWFYPVFFEMFNHGQTPGKRLLGLMVIHDNGTPVGWQASMIRNLLLVVDFLPIAYGVGLVSMLANDRSKRLGDWVAGTLVIYQSQVNRVYQIPVMKPLAPPWSLSPQEQRVLLDFAERAGALSASRREELAQILLQNHPEMETTFKALQENQSEKMELSLLIFRYANWLLRGVNE